MPSAAAAASADILAGGRYELLEVLGRGGVGVVYRARDRALDEILAIKLLAGPSSGDAQEIERFKREIITARKITHPNVIRIHELGFSGTEAFISMELLPGGTLADVIEKESPIPVRRAVDIAIGVCEGLEAAHAQGIVHRDLKPDNVLFDAGGNPKLVDFGLARLATSTTKTVGFSGTPFYMSPEQADGSEVTARSDLYSLGVLLYELFTGKLPFVADSLVRIAMLHANEPPPSPRAVRPDLPRDLEAMLLKALQKDPMQRYARAADIAEDLRLFRDGRAMKHTPANTDVTVVRKGGPSAAVRPVRQPTLKGESVRVTEAPPPSAPAGNEETVIGSARPAPAPAAKPAAPVRPRKTGGAGSAPAALPTPAADPALRSSRSGAARGSPVLRPSDVFEVPVDVKGPPAPSEKRRVGTFVGVALVGLGAIGLGFLATHLFWSAGPSAQSTPVAVLPLTPLPQPATSSIAVETSTPAPASTHVEQPQRTPVTHRTPVATPVRTLHALATSTPPSTPTQVTLEPPDAFLTFAASGMSVAVYIDGKRMGETPKRDLPVSAGDHEVQIVDRNTGELYATTHLKVRAGAHELYHYDSAKHRLFRDRGR